MELVCQLLPSPISTRLYDTYPETVKVRREKKDDRDGQTQGRSRQKEGVEERSDCGQEIRGQEENGRGS
jgi:hypothetical protein